MKFRFLVTGLLLVSALSAQPGDVENAFAEFQRVWKTVDKNGAANTISDDVTWFSVRGRSLDKQQVLDSLSRRGGLEGIRDKKVRV